MRLASVHTYPVKSCHRVEHGKNPVRVEPWGLAGDRRWLVVDPDGKCVTQRQVAGLARVRPSPGAGGLRLATPDAPDLVVAMPDGNEMVQVTVHGTVVADQETGERGAEPLRILARYRRVGQKVLFGVNLIPDPPYGEVAAGDPVELLQTG